MNSGSRGNSPLITAPTFNNSHSEFVDNLSHHSPSYFRRCQCKPPVLKSSKSEIFNRSDTALSVSPKRVFETGDNAISPYNRFVSYEQFHDLEKRVDDAEKKTSLYKAKLYDMSSRYWKEVAHLRSKLASQNGSNSEALRLQWFSDPSELNIDTEMMRAAEERAKMLFEKRIIILEDQVGLTQQQLKSKDDELEKFKKDTLILMEAHHNCPTQILKLENLVESLKNEEALLRRLNDEKQLKNEELVKELRKVSYDREDFKSRMQQALDELEQKSNENRILQQKNDKLMKENLELKNKLNTLALHEQDLTKNSSENNLPPDEQEILQQYRIFKSNDSRALFIANEVQNQLEAEGVSGSLFSPEQSSTDKVMIVRNALASLVKNDHGSSSITKALASLEDKKILNHVQIDAIKGSFENSNQHAVKAQRRIAEMVKISIRNDENSNETNIDNAAESSDGRNTSSNRSGRLKRNRNGISVSCQSRTCLVITDTWEIEKVGDFLAAFRSHRSKLAWKGDVLNDAAVKLQSWWRGVSTRRSINLFEQFINGGRPKNEFLRKRPRIFRLPRQLNFTIADVDDAAIELYKPHLLQFRVRNPQSNLPILSNINNNQMKYFPKSDNYRPSANFRQSVSEDSNADFIFSDVASAPISEDEGEAFSPLANFFNQNKTPTTNKVARGSVLMAGDGLLHEEGGMQNDSLRTQQACPRRFSIINPLSNAYRQLLERKRLRLNRKTRVSPSLGEYSDVGSSEDENRGAERISDAVHLSNMNTQLVNSIDQWVAGGLEKHLSTRVKVQFLQKNNGLVNESNQKPANWSALGVQNWDWLLEDSTDLAKSMACGAVAEASDIWTSPPSYLKVFSMLAGCSRSDIEIPISNPQRTAALIGKRLFVTAGTEEGEVGIRSWLDAMMEALGQTVHCMLGTQTSVLHILRAMMGCPLAVDIPHDANNVLGQSSNSSIRQLRAFNLTGASAQGFAHRIWYGLRACVETRRALTEGLCETLPVHFVTNANSPLRMVQSIDRKNLGIGLTSAQMSMEAMEGPLLRLTQLLLGIQPLLPNAQSLKAAIIARDTMEAALSSNNGRSLPSKGSYSAYHMEDGSNPAANNPILSSRQMSKPRHPKRPHNEIHTPTSPGSYNNNNSQSSNVTRRQRPHSAVNVAAGASGNNTVVGRHKADLDAEIQFNLSLNPLRSPIPTAELGLSVSRPNSALGPHSRRVIAGASRMMVDTPVLLASKEGASPKDLVWTHNFVYDRPFSPPRQRPMSSRRLGSPNKTNSPSNNNTHTFSAGTSLGNSPIVEDNFQTPTVAISKKDRSHRLPLKSNQTMNATVLFNGQTSAAVSKSLLPSFYSPRIPYSGMDGVPAADAFNPNYNHGSGIIVGRGYGPSTTAFDLHNTTHFNSPSVAPLPSPPPVVSARTTRPQSQFTSLRNESAVGSAAVSRIASKLANANTLVSKALASTDPSFSLN